MQKSMRLFGVILFYVLSSQKVFSFQITPMVQEFSFSGKNSTQTFVVDNSAGPAVGIEVEATTRTHDVHGKENRVATDDFSVYPLQFSIAAKEKKSVRVSFLKGKQDTGKELSYRLIFRQMPVDVDKKEKKQAKAQINFLFEYVASVYVTPDNAKSKIEVISVGMDKKNVKAIIQNIGTKHALLKDLKITLSDKKMKHTFSETELKETAARNILAGEKSEILLPLPAELTSSNLTLDVSE